MRHEGDTDLILASRAVELRRSPRNSGSGLRLRALAQVLGPTPLRGSSPRGSEVLEADQKLLRSPDFPPLVQQDFGSFVCVCVLHY